jgi:cytochrome b involved in lipid metabolism
MKADVSVRCGVLRPIPEGRQPLPSRGKQLLESPYQWMEDKRVVDSAAGIPPNLWAVRGKLYDLQPFIERHPGGSTWLTLTQGSDITDFYEVSSVSAFDD